MSHKVHHHSLLRMRCELIPGHQAEDTMAQFLVDLVESVGMKVLVPPVVRLGPYGYTGLVGIQTSHITFHYFLPENLLMLDVYSCREYPLERIVALVHQFWTTVDGELLFVDREDAASSIRYAVHGSHIALGKVPHTVRSEVS